MNGKKRNLRSNNEAVSELIGVILLMAIFVTLYAMLQATAVPMWNKQVEAVEIKVTSDDMMFLPSDIEDVAMHETPKTFTVQLGARYPDRMIFRNPGPGAFGTLAVEEAPAPINITYNNGTEYIVPYNSARITYEMSGTINSPKLVYEHGVIITDWGTVNLTTDEQKLIENDNIYIPIVNGSSLSKSAIGVESLAIKPYEYLDTLGNISYVTVTLDTDYPEVWWGLLEEYIDQGMVSISNQTKEITITTDVPYLKLPDQTASGSLHAGMISCTVEDPDGGDDDDDLWVAGEGTDIMAMGSRVANIPCSENATAIVIQDIVVDEDPSPQAPKLDADVIVITVTDKNWNWWKAQISMKEPKNIVNIKLKSANGISEWKVVYQGSPFTQSTVIDLFNSSNFDTKSGIGGMYQNASVVSDNRLVTIVSDDVQASKTKLISYRLQVAD